MALRHAVSAAEVPVARVGICGCAGHAGRAAWSARLVVPCLLSLLAACAGSREGAVRRDFQRAQRPTAAAAIVARRPTSSPTQVPVARGAASAGQAVEPAVSGPGFGGAQSGAGSATAAHDAQASAEGDARPGRHGADHGRGYRAYSSWALAHSPAVRAAYGRWAAAVHRISGARKLPEPTVTFGWFVRPVETRVGPQRARIGIRQTLPWPATLTAGADAASAQARVAQRTFEAVALRVVERVATAYWDLWQVRETRRIHERHLGVIRGLAETVRARMAVGMATLADLQQIDLTAARLEDGIVGMGDQERTAAARLRAAVGMAANRPVPTTVGPAALALPEAEPADLRLAAREHPSITAYGLLAEFQESRAEVEAGQRMPSFSIGADWIVTGRSGNGVPDSGKDAVIVGGGLTVPLWQGSYHDGISAARAQAAAERAERRSALDSALAELEAALSATRDGGRRAHLYSRTLLPQAESAYSSVLGAYTTGRGTVAQTLLAQRDVLELRVELQRARADHARGWARLEQIVGRPLERRPLAAGTVPSRPRSGSPAQSSAAPPPSRP